MATRSTQIRQQIDELVDRLPDLADDEVAFVAAEREVEELEKQLARIEKAELRAAKLARPVAGTAALAGIGEGTFIPVPAPSRKKNTGIQQNRQFDDFLAEARELMQISQIDTSKNFANFSDQLQAVAGASRSGGAFVDPRLRRGTDTLITRSVLGQSTIDPSGGGFLVQQDFANALLMRIYETGQLWSKTTKFQIGEAANGIKIPAVDETSRVEGQRYGGIQVYLSSEGATITPSGVKVRTVDLDLKKLVGAFWVTDEMLQDAQQIVQLGNTALAEEIGFKLDDLLVRGTGAGQPLGWLNAMATVSVAKETGQKANTIVYENLLNMESHMWGPSKKNSVWLINSDVMPQLRQMSLAVGVGGLPVYLPAGGAAEAPYGAMLLGRPVMEIEQAATAGTVGDINLVDLSQILAAEKGGIKATSSIHVQFLTDQMVFKFTMRIDAQPWWHSSLTPAQGSLLKSPYITLATRA